MSESKHTVSNPAVSEEEPLYGVSKELIDSLKDALESGKRKKIIDLMMQLHPADAADLIEGVDDLDRHRLIAILKGRFNPEILAFLSANLREDVVEYLSPQEVAAAVAGLDSDDALSVLEDLDQEHQREVLQAVPAKTRVGLEEVLSYPEDSAGRLMQREMVVVPSFWKVGNVIDFMAKAENLPDVFYDIFVVDPRLHPIGSVPLSQLLRHSRQTKIEKILFTDIKRIPVTMDQEEVAFLFRQYGLASAPVVDGDGRIVGMVTVDDVVTVIDEEAAEDIMHMGGVSETNLHFSAFLTAYKRVRWLAVTLINSLLSAVVVYQFQATIEKVVALAVLMPVLSAMAGNAGVQVVTVTVRSLATRELHANNMWRIFNKELMVAAFTGISLSFFLLVIVGIVFNDIKLGLVTGVAMIFSVLWAGFAGMLLPVVITRLGWDPAINAGPILTTATDVIGFAVFLSLATWFLL